MNEREAVRPNSGINAELFLKFFLSFLPGRRVCLPGELSAGKPVVILEGNVGPDDIVAAGETFVGAKIVVFEPESKRE